MILLDSQMMGADSTSDSSCMNYHVSSYTFIYRKRKAQISALFALLGGADVRYDKKPDPRYKTAAWRRARTAALERDHYICQDCLSAKQRGERLRPRAATTVHHIIPIKEHPELMLELSNLVSLCDPCHNKRHPEKGMSDVSAAEPIHTGIRVIKV